MPTAPERLRRAVKAVAAAGAAIGAVKVLRRRKAPAVTGEARWQPLAAPDTPPSRDGGAWVEPVDGVCPATHPVKGNADSGIFHVPGGAWYDRTMPERCYATAADAEADGFRAARR